jgi:hypothetical protein
MAPVATIVPWPGISRGTEATVPMPPGLVSTMLAPRRSSTLRVLLRARAMSRSYSSRKAAKVIAPASRITGTTRNRLPSLRRVSTAIPRWVPGWTRQAEPSRVRSKWQVIEGTSSAARTIA